MDGLEGIELTGLGGQIEDAYRTIADQLVNDATKFQFFVRAYYDNSLRIELLQGLKLATDSILEQKQVILPLLAALSHYLDKNIREDLLDESSDVT